MKKGRFTEEQPGGERHESGGHLSEVGVREQTFYTWKRKYRGLGVSELRNDGTRHLLFTRSISRGCAIAVLLE